MDSSFGSRVGALDVRRIAYAGLGLVLLVVLVVVLVRGV
jgi:hypothetical protein